MLSDGNILRFTVMQTYLGQVCLNVDYRQVTLLDTEPEDYNDIAFGYRANWINAIQSNFQVAAVTLNQVLVENVSDGVGVGANTTPVNSSNAGEGAPSFVALGIRQNRTTRITRHGQKRIVGLPENYFAANTLTIAPGFIAAAEEFFEDPMLVSMGAALDNVELTPVIVGRTLNVGSGVYELDLGKINPVSSAVVTRMTSQNSRKA